MTQKARILASLDALIERKADQIAQDVFEDVVENTPVDTGQAKRGWRRFTDERGVRHVANPEHHILQLNRGSSTKAPAAFVQGAIAKALRR
ncbi:MAG: hypothetical protein OXH79_03125 [Boseongicola sp.]|nr:hypothetical protein [Boseongicola sp.]